MLPRPISTVPVACLTLLCLALAGIELALVGRNRELRARVAELEQQVTRAGQSAVPGLEGRPFPVLALIDAEGEPLGLTELAATHATLLFVSSPACDFCDQARPLWERVARQLAGAPVRVLELVLEPDGGGGAARPAPFPQLTAGAGEELLMRWLPGLPAALLIDSSGVVQRAVYGADETGLEALLDEQLTRAAALSAR